MLDSFFTLFFNTLATLGKAKVFGSLKDVLCHTFAFLVVWVPFLTAVAALLDFLDYKNNKISTCLDTPKRTDIASFETSQRHNCFTYVLCH
jgi:hypothetical protein